MRVGFVGLGRIGAAHAAVVRDHPDVDQLVVADADPERAKAVADRLAARTAAAATTPAEVTVAHEVPAALSDVDALVVAAATAAHAELIVAGVEAGLPTFCEKPVAPDVAGHLRVLEAVRSTGVQVHIGFQRRFDAGYLAAREAVRSGALGEVRRLHLVTGDEKPPHADYIPRSGGLWRDCHVHDFDILRFVTGREVEEVYAVGANRGAAFFAEAGDIDEAAAVLTLDDGTLATLQGSRYNGGGHDVRMEVAGTEATWVVGLGDHAPIVPADPGVPSPAGEPWPDFWHRFLPAYEAELNAFVDVALGRTVSPCTVEEALEAFYVAEAATLSRAEHRPVRVGEVRS
ncbi:MAG TPA: Gfo/Idh/MocA family oxidoreductase [Jiangellales bacterium]|nr:Gfo/Idh/MocA family oxidoreductase [Jiangellales bacterium]